MSNRKSIFIKIALGVTAITGVLLFVWTMLLKEKELTTSEGGVAGRDAYTEMVEPIFKKHNCYDCHSGDSAKAKLDLSVAGTSIEGIQGILSVVDPGHPNQSELIGRVTDRNDPMPPEGKGEMLNAAEVGVLSEWISSKAKLPIAPGPLIKSSKPEKTDYESLFKWGLLLLLLAIQPIYAIWGERANWVIILRVFGSICFAGFVISGFLWWNAEQEEPSAYILELSMDNIELYDQFQETKSAKVNEAIKNTIIYFFGFLIFYLCAHVVEALNAIQIYLHHITNKNLHREDSKNDQTD